MTKKNNRLIRRKYLIFRHDYQEKLDKISTTLCRVLLDQNIPKCPHAVEKI